MFTFGFEKGGEHKKNDEKHETTVWVEAKQIFPRDVITDLREEKIDPRIIPIFECGALKLKHFPVDAVLHHLAKRKFKKAGIIDAELIHSDLIPSIYEGGLKIWECTRDLLGYLASNNYNFAGKRVLDLGCGAGLLGILALTRGASVDFQDYNADVIKYLTIPNVWLNLIDKTKLETKCKFYSGDWASFTELTKDEPKYDVILTSETIYNEDNYIKLHGVFEKRMEPRGIIFLAAKTYYFGVGGGMRQFENLLCKQRVFFSKEVWRQNTGICREIIRIIKIKL